MLARNVAAQGRSRAWVGGASVPVTTLGEVAEPLVAVHGQSDQHRLLRAGAQRAALDRFGGEDMAAVGRPTTPRLWAELAATERTLADVVGSARERAREADQLRFGLGEVEAVDPRPGEDVELAAEETRLGFADTLRAAAETAREALSSEDGAPDALGTTSAARQALEGVREHDETAGELADRIAELGHLLVDVAGDVASYASSLETDPARLAARLGAPCGADRADPQVRRDHRRGAGLGARTAPSGCSTSTTPTAGSPSWRPVATGSARSSAPSRRP